MLSSLVIGDCGIAAPEISFYRHSFFYNGSLFNLRLDVDSDGSAQKTAVDCIYSSEETRISMIYRD